MHQRTLAMATGFERYSKKTRRAEFLEEMEQVVPWGKLGALIEPHYPKAGNGRPPIGLERMLRMYFLQQWFNLSDPAVEEALYDSVVMREFVALTWGGNRCRTRRPSANFAIYWKSTDWAERCWR
jgi:IS5 family transposase